MAEFFHGNTDTGKLRDNNEDAFLAQLSADKKIMAAVIDGVGGYEGGEIAAALARDIFIDQLNKPGLEPKKRLIAAVSTANDRILEEKLKNADHAQMACVISAVLVDPEANQLHYAHVGDTRIYLLRDESLVKLTHDQSFVGFLEDSGRLNEEQAMGHPKRNEINNALGFKPYRQWDDQYLELGESPFLPGDALLLCSDGLTDMVPVQGMKDILNSNAGLEQKVQRLIDAANAAGGRDNITVVLVSHPRKPLKQKRTRPVLVKKDESEPVVEAQTALDHAREVLHVQPQAGPKKRGSRWFLWLLIFLLIVAGALYWFWNSRQPKVLMPAPANRDTIVKPDPFERRTSLQLDRDTLDLSALASAGIFRLSDTVSVDRDTLYIHGGGTTLSADSNYHGAALVLSAASRYLRIDSLTLQGFTTAIMASDQRIVLNGVRFRDCAIPVTYGLSLPSDSLLDINLKKPSFK